MKLRHENLNNVDQPNVKSQMQHLRVYPMSTYVSLNRKFAFITNKSGFNSFIARADMTGLLY